MAGFPAQREEPSAGRRPHDRRAVAWQRPQSRDRGSGRLALVEHTAISDPLEWASEGGGRHSHLRALRLLLLVVAAVQLAVAVPQLLLHSGESLREMGAFDMALVVGFAVVALRPGRARSLSPVLGTAGCLCLAIALEQILTGHSRLGDEAPDAIGFVGWFVVALVARASHSGGIFPTGARQRSR